MRVRSFLLLLSALLLLPSATAGAAGQLFAVSVPNVPVERGERIAGLSLRMKGASLHSFREIPVGWIWQVGNHGSLHTEVDGLAEVGAAALDADFVDDLFVIKRREVAGLAFSLELVLRVTTDFSVTREVTLRQPELVLKPR